MHLLEPIVLLLLTVCAAGLYCGDKNCYELLEVKP